MLISNRGITGYTNLSYRDCFTEKACYKIGFSATAQNQQTGLGLNDVDTRELTTELRYSTVHDVSDGVKITWGGNHTFNRYEQDYVEYKGEKYAINFDDHLFGAFFETEIKFSKNVAIRPGIRSEHSSVLNKWNVAPRFALAIKTSKNSQFSGAWGLYHQTPQADYFKLNTKLEFEKASHYIVSYQAGEVSKRLFRAEAYYKNYKQLIRYEMGANGLPANLNNDGFGYAGGVDVFWRDQKSAKGFNYWLTY